MWLGNERTLPGNRTVWYTGRSIREDKEENRIRMSEGPDQSSYLEDI